MPTASEYRAAGLRFRQLGEQLARQAALVAGWRIDEVATGPVLRILADRLQAAARRLSAAAESCARVAGVCDLRAEICAEYRRRVQAYWALPAIERLASSPPQPPYAWVRA